MKIAIVDDCKKDREKLYEDILKWAKENNILLDMTPLMFESGESFLESMKDNGYDVVFLDIYMDGITGMETARLIREKNMGCRLVFISSSNEFAAESYEVDSTYYLVKPYSYEKLVMALKRCAVSVLKKEQSILFPGKSERERLYIHDIVYTEYANRHVTVHKKDGSNQLISVKQSDFAEALLEFPCFCDCMKGVLVNLEMVEQLQRDRFLLKTGEYVPISRLKYQNVRELFLDYSYARVREEYL